MTMPFASTTIVETWSGTDISQLGPIYPMVGTEVVLFVLGLAFWLAFHVLQIRIENVELKRDAEAARSETRLTRVFEAEAHSGQ